MRHIGLIERAVVVAVCFAGLALSTGCATAPKGYHWEDPRSASATGRDPCRTFDNPWGQSRWSPPRVLVKDRVLTEADWRGITKDALIMTALAVVPFWYGMHR